MSRVYLLFLLVTLSIAASMGQLTFSSGWKRSATFGNEACKPDQALINIYEMIKSEAERLISCQK